jgi:preprotein translocase subunit YajC
MAQDGSAGGASGNPILSFVPFILIFVIFYFLLVLPQQKKAKKRKAMLEALKKGDRVTTTGGLIGTVTTLGPQMVTLQIAEGVRVKIARPFIEEVHTGSAEESEEKSK